MKLWIISQGIHNSYDTYDSAVVAAETEEEARKIHPASQYDENYDHWKRSYDWADRPDQVDVELIGEAIEGTEVGVIVASFNAG